MTRYKLTLKYDGTDFCGWQVQKNGISVQQTVQDAMETLFLYRPLLSGCSRTDSGVHANEYVCHFDYDGNINTENILKALNTYLPPTITVIGCEKANNDFHARYSAKSKEYVYKIYTGEHKNPFLYKYSYHYKNVDIKLINEAAEYFIGTHDFKAFCSSGSSIIDTTRTIYKLTAQETDDIVNIYIQANGFLYNMVRIITGTLLDVSDKKTEPSYIKTIIQKKERKLAGKTAPPQGLFLNKIYY